MALTECFHYRYFS